MSIHMERSGSSSSGEEINEFQDETLMQPISLKRKRLRLVPEEEKKSFKKHLSSQIEKTISMESENLCIEEMSDMEFKLKKIYTKIGMALVDPNMATCECKTCFKFRNILSDMAAMEQMNNQVKITHIIQ